MNITRISLAAIVAASLTLLPAAQARPESGGYYGNPKKASGGGSDNSGSGSGSGSATDDSNKGGTPPTPPTDANGKPLPPLEIRGKGEGKGGPVDSKGQQLPDSVKNDTKLQALLAEAQKAREAFLASQKDLQAKLKGATADEKAAIKEQLKANQQKFLDDTKQLRADIADRLKELGVDLKTRGVNAGGGEAGQHKRPGQ
jgi:hypothetical protein